MRYRLIQTGLDVMGFMQADRWLAGLGMAGLKRGSGFILTLHRVRPAEQRTFAPNHFLDITPEFLDHSLTYFKKAGFSPLPIEQVPGRLASPRPRDKPFFVVTFDDGYRDVLDYAWPVLRKHGCPWTIYVTSDYACGRGRIWWLELEQAIANQTSITLALKERPQIIETRTLAQKKRAYNALRQLFYTTPSDQWCRLLNGLGPAASPPPQLTPARLCADWQELAALNADPDVTIGSHTLTHPILSRISDAQALDEIEGSRTAIFNALGEQPAHFAYPSGGAASFTARDVALVQKAGYQTAVTTRPAHLWPIASPDAQIANPLLALPRISLNGHFQSDQWLRAIVSGLPFKRG